MRQCETCHEAKDTVQSVCIITAPALSCILLPRPTNRKWAKIAHICLHVDQILDNFDVIENTHSIVNNSD